MISMNVPPTPVMPTHHAPTARAVSLVAATSTSPATALPVPSMTSVPPRLVTVTPIALTPPLVLSAPVTTVTKVIFI